jgi:membrane protein DedA with SNARE-associated domain
MISEFVATYGYLSIFFGTLLEGETILIAGGFAAHRGMLNLPLVILVAIVGSSLGDQLAFWLGRYKGNALMERVPALARRKDRIHELLHRYDALFIVTVRFLYGLRIAGPLIIGASQVAPLRFAALNLVGATLWAVVISGVGYFLGLGSSAFLGHMKGLEEAVLAAIVVCGLLYGLWRQIFRWRRARQR